ncbi:D-alanyl-D-alanine carboxypeptidase [Caldibacillus thermolactis]|jgi:serine-type D-Ala-D-Ala carboxypeptidase (penicillin-binding protein 5/6)|uniref:D-alanyl-D-alanine carboxypeptidase n=1 Tax=Pallidibacillus thermolactis TaxID=251051 RepID=A0ABT2WJZ9_9BACI|nr:D-alanyl-D-alanine carboxypeptidase family protein [Pallidibacillus thermolactis]MCU9595796.1 D-alanyl-D-alanine carboxypeptidase [Pallidibacillus thermolactis]
MKIRKLFISIVLFLLLFPYNIAAQSTDIPKVFSEAAILIDAKSGQTIYGKNENKRMNPASITKIATAIYAIENGDLSDDVVISETATKVEGTTVFLEPGEVVTLKKLIIGMIVNSGNDAALAIAEHIDGSLANFEKHFNAYLQDYIGVNNTHFENPHGLYGENHYSTAHDMAKITKYAMENETFRSIINIQEYKWDGASWDTTLVNHHRLILGEFPYDAQITGGKNGFINESGYTLVTTATKGNLNLIAVTMKTDDKDVPYTDTLNLFDFGFQNFQTKKIPKGTEFTVQDKKFITKKDLLYTVNIHERYTNEVDTSGLLTIYNQLNEPIVSFQLKSTNEPMQKENSADIQMNWKSDGIVVSLEVAFVCVVIFVAVIVIQRLKNRV